MTLSAGEDLTDYQFDLHARYRALSEVLVAALPGEGPRRLLDVGAGPSRLTAAFLPAGWAEIVRTDVESFDDPTIGVVPPGAPLPFDDGAFDAVVAMDVLEHVEPAQRAGFVRECARVASGVAVLAAPIGDPAVVQAEARYRTLYREITGHDEPYLDEHVRLGLPGADEVERAATDCTVVTLDSVRLGDWVATNVVDLAFALVDDGLALKRILARRFNETLPVRLRGADHYRRFHLLTRDAGVASRLRVLVDPSVLPEAGPHEVDPLTVVVRAFRDYAERWHGPTLESLVADRERKAEDLAEQLRQKEAHVAKLDAAAVELHAALAAKDVHIAGLTRQYDALAATLAETVAAKDAHAASLIDAIVAKDARTMQLIEALQRAGIALPGEPERG